MSISSSLMYIAGTSYENWPEEAREQIVADMDPPEEVKQTEISQYRGSWLEQMEPRRKLATEFETSTFRNPWPARERPRSSSTRIVVEGRKASEPAWGTVSLAA